MSLKKNIFANYVSQIYVTLVGVVMLPLYVKYMGAEAYGLVGFFAMLQVWFQLLDMGLTPTMARETARFNGGACSALELRRLLRTLEGIFLGVALLGAGAMWASAGGIAKQWLKVQQLPLVEVEHALQLMAIIVALRWVSGLYRGAINGFEKQVWLSSFNSAVATARFVLVIPFFIWVGSSPGLFFGFQLVIAVFELVWLVGKTYAIFPKAVQGASTPWAWQPLRRVLRFSLGIAFTSSVWVLVTQTDKLILSKFLPLTDYGYFTLAVLVAGGVLTISSPISAALMPRLVKLNAEHDEAGLIQLYRNATQLVAVIALPVCTMLAFFSEQVLWAWTGDAALAGKAAPVLTLYVIGNGILVLAAFPYYLQYAKGDLTLHMIGNAIFVLLLIPSLIWASWRYGATGAGWAWLGSNAVAFALWLPMVHARFCKGLHIQWLLRDIAPIAISSIAFGVTSQWLFAWPTQRGPIALQIGALGVLALLVASLSTSWVRKKISNQCRNHYAAQK
ncbi:oligosaccharide flippase family protein [Polaromonas jejuensis]